MTFFIKLSLIIIVACNVGCIWHHSGYKPCNLDPSWTPQWSNIVSYFRFDETAGSISNGNTILSFVGLNGAAVNPNGSGMSYTIGKHQNSVSLDGVDDYINLLPATNLPTGSNPRAIMGWFTPSQSGNFQTFFNYGTGGAGGRNTITATVVEVSIAFTGHRIGVNGLNLSGWHHVAFVFPTGATMSNQVVMYLDGARQTLSDLNGATVTVNTGLTEAWLGANAALSSFFQGQIDEFAVWNTDLTADDVKYIYERQSSACFK